MDVILNFVFVSILLIQPGQNGSTDSKNLRGEEIRAVLEQQLQNIQLGRSVMSSEELASQFGSSGLQVLSSYLDDESTEARGKVAAIVGIIAFRADGESRRAAARLLVRFAGDNNDYVARVALRGLRFLELAEFDDDDRHVLLGAVQRERPTPAAILACGIAGVGEAIPRLREIHSAWQDLGNTEHLRGRGWNAELALARLGEAVQRNLALKRIGGVLDIYERALLMDDAQYIRHVDVVPLILDVLKSDAPHRNPGDATEIPPAQRAAIALSQMLVDFPLPTRIGSFTREELQAIRDWVDRRTSWNIRK